MKIPFFSMSFFELSFFPIFSLDTCYRNVGSRRFTGSQDSKIKAPKQLTQTCLHVGYITVNPCNKVSSC